MPTACPRCGSDLTLAVPGSLPWCGTCEWNLDVHDKRLAPWRGTVLLGRWGFRRGAVLDDRARERLQADPGAPAPARTRGEVWLTALTGLLAVVFVALLLYLAWLVLGTDLPVGVRLLLALPAVALLLLLRPVVPTLPKGLAVGADAAPELHALIRDVADAVGAPPPDVVAIDSSINAGVAQVGWRQQSLLVIGMPLWLTLPRAARLSVLAHEMGHLVGGDPLRMRRTLPARTFGARAVAATGGRNPWSRAFSGGASAAEQGGGLLGFVIHGAVAVVNVVAATVQLLVDSVAMPDSRLAEYRADLVAVRVAGTRAFLESFETSLVAHYVWEDLWHIAPRIEPDDLERSAAVGLETAASRVRAERQLTRRTTDLWSTHPSADQRMRLVESLPTTEPTLTVSDERWQRVDAELAPWRRRTHRALLGSRDRL